MTFAAPQRLSAVTRRSSRRRSPARFPSRTTTRRTPGRTPYATSAVSAASVDNKNLPPIARETGPNVNGRRHGDRQLRSWVARQGPRVRQQDGDSRSRWPASPIRPAGSIIQHRCLPPPTRSTHRSFLPVASTSTLASPLGAAGPTASGCRLVCAGPTDRLHTTSLTLPVLRGRRVAASVGRGLGEGQDQLAQAPSRTQPLSL